MATIVTVFGSSHPVAGDRDYEIAFEVGKLLAAAGFVVCNGGYGGVMEASARGAKSAGGATIGVTIKGSNQTPNRWLDQVFEKESLIARLQKLISLGDAYVVLKGGTGTLLELAAVWEFINKNLMYSKPVVVVGSFWADVLHTLQGQLRAEGSRAADAIRMVETPQQCVEFLRRRLSYHQREGT